MGFDPGQWHRFEFDDTPIYVRPDPPCWFVPNAAGDALLQAARDDSPTAESAAARRFFDRLPEAAGSDYRGRYPLLHGIPLREFWFHLTNRCNLSCRHCLFGASPNEARELAAGLTLEAARQASRLGCRVFALTGGEPFIHPAFAEIVEGLLALPESHVVILTNGLLARQVWSQHRWDRSRLHLQISLDGLQAGHDAIRGRGTFARTVSELHRLTRNGVPFTLSVCPTRRNLDELEPLVDLAAEIGAANLHFMWYFVRGRGGSADFVPPRELFPVVRSALERAERHGLGVDNVQNLAGQIFAPSGTRHDGSGSAWESLAMGPDGRIYPSAALVGIEPLAADWTGDLAAIWRGHSVLEEIRRCTAADSDHPLRFLLGGGDLDHSYLHQGRFLGADPYLELHQQLALYLISRRAPAPDRGAHPALRLKMGDVLQSCGSHGATALTHANCLLALAAPSSLAVVRDYYGDAALEVKEEILNPVCYPEELLAHVPQAHRFRGYGCGSPVLDAAIRSGETVVDLGCGSGVECFIAARQVGADGRVIGIDMLEAMLARARAGAAAVARTLGYANLSFHRSLLEALPLASNRVDLVVSNCVLNLSADKRGAFSEIFRVLRPGGRLVVSDVVCDHEPDAAIRNDPLLHSQCLGGALTQRDLTGLLDEAGFGALRLIKRFPYREVRGQRFFSLTFEARKPAVTGEVVEVIYRGPLAQVLTPGGTALVPGAIYRLPRWEAEALEDQLLVLDANGAVRNQNGQSACACATAPETGSAARSGSDPAGASGAKVKSRLALKRRFGCMVCGAPLVYQPSESERTCAYCGQTFTAGSGCQNGHFVCDACHSADALTVIEHLVLSSTEIDLIALFDKIRRHPVIPVHGPEHHALVPAVLVAAQRNAGGRVDDAAVRTALRRGAQVPGGACGFLGCCGAAVGVGVAFSILLQANPVKPVQRQQVQQITQAVLAEIGALQAARCCQRDAWIALRKAAELSRDLLDQPLRADHILRCRQQARNPECLGAACPVNQQLNGHLSAALPA